MATPGGSLEFEKFMRSFTTNITFTAYKIWFSLTAQNLWSDHILIEVTIRKSEHSTAIFCVILKLVCVHRIHYLEYNFTAIVLNIDVLIYLQTRISVT